MKTINVFFDNTLRRSVIAMALLLSSLSIYADPSADDIIAAVGIPQDQVSSLKNGEIISFDLTEATDKSLATGIAMYLQVSPSKVADYVRKGNLYTKDPDVIAYGQLPDGAGPDAFKKFAYTAAQADEAGSLLQVKAGSDFNLSTQEILGFNSLGINRDDDKAVTAAASSQYRKVLSDRFNAYQTKGLSGIAPYDRGNGVVSDPGSELATDNHQNKVLRQFYPAFYQGLQQFPAGLPDGTESKFFWVNRNVQDRPTPVLQHRLIYSVNDRTIFVSREYYVGHSYNSSQTVAGSLPYLDGTLVIYGLQSSTDQVTGMGQTFKHSVGREQLTKAMIKKFQNLKSSL